MRLVRAFGSSVLTCSLVLVAAAGALAVGACSDSSSDAPAGEADTGVSTKPEGDGASNEDATTVDAGDAGADAEEALPTTNESEPNNGAGSPPQVNTLPIPGIAAGVVDPVGDVDVFSITMAPGDFWEWTATPTGADLAPHITVFDSSADALNPTVIGFAGAGAPATLQHFVQRPGTFLMVLRDARNVGTTATKGGPTFGYRAAARKKTPAPTTVTFPTTKTGKLASVGSVDFYTFTGTGGKGFDIVVNADRKTPKSTLDSRLSLFDLGSKTAIITNDNASVTTTDSQVGSDDALPGTYLVIVENEGKDGTDLSYEIQFKQRP